MRDGLRQKVTSNLLLAQQMLLWAAVEPSIYPSYSTGAQQLDLIQSHSLAL